MTERPLTSPEDQSVQTADLTKLKVDLLRYLAEIQESTTGIIDLTAHMVPDEEAFKRSA